MVQDLGLTSLVCSQCQMSKSTTRVYSIQDCFPVNHGLVNTDCTVRDFGSKCLNCTASQVRYKKAEGTSDHKSENVHKKPGLQQMNVSIKSQTTFHTKLCLSK